MSWHEILHLRNSLGLVSLEIGIHQGCLHDTGNGLQIFQIITCRFGRFFQILQVKLVPQVHVSTLSFEYSVFVVLDSPFAISGDTL